MIGRRLRAAPVLGNWLRLAYGMVASRRVRVRASLHLRLIALSRLLVRQRLRGFIVTDGGEVYLAMPDGLLLYYNVADPRLTRGDGQSLEFLAAPNFSPQEKFLLACVADGATYVDVGANCGYFYTLKVARRHAGARVVAFEPDPRILDHLAKNIAANKLANITVVAVALADAPGARAMTAALGASNFLVSRRAGEAGECITVACDSLDAYAETHGLADIAAIKVDIEGGEYDFLRGARACLLRQRPILLLELDDALLQRSGASLEAALTLLREAQYRCFRVNGSTDALAIPLAAMERFPAGGESWLTEMTA